MAMVKETSYQFHLFGLDATTGAITLQAADRRLPHQRQPPHLQRRTPGPADRPAAAERVGVRGVRLALRPPALRRLRGRRGRGQRPTTTTLWTDEAGVSDDQAGIWQSGGGLMSDGPGRIFFTSGNGISPAPGPGSKPPGQLAESVVRLAANPDGSLAAQDFFSPANAPTLDAGDTDFGAGGPVGLPFGTATYPDILVAGGQGRPDLPAQPQQPRRPRAGPGNGRRGPVRGRPVRRPVGPPRGLRRHHDADPRQRHQLQRLHGLRRQERLHAGVQGRGQPQRHSPR